MLERTLKFYSRYNFRVIVVDGSSKPLTSDVLNSDCIDYFHKPIHADERLKFALSLTETPYFSQVPDDDFILPSANIACIDYLNEMPDYVACTGRALFYEEYPKGVLYREAFPGYRDKDIYQQLPKARLQKFFSNYEVLHTWAVMRSHVIKTAVRICTDPIVQKLLMFEIAFEFAVCAQGKSKVINHLRWIRSRCPGMDWRLGIPENQNYTDNSYLQQEQAEKVYSVFQENLPEIFNDISCTSFLEIVNSLNDDTSRQRWFTDSTSTSVPISFKLRQSLKSLIKTLMQPNKLRRISAETLAEMRSQLVKINDEEIGYINFLLAQNSISYKVQ